MLELRREAVGVSLLSVAALCVASVSVVRPPARADLTRLKRLPSANDDSCVSCESSRKPNEVKASSLEVDAGVRCPATAVILCSLSG